MDLLCVGAVALKMRCGAALEFSDGSAQSVLPRVRAVSLQRDVALCLALLGGVTQCGSLSSRRVGHCAWRSWVC